MDGSPPGGRPSPLERMFMTYEEFTALSTEEEKRAIFQSMADDSILFTDMEAERDSFKTENEKLIKENQDLKTEMKKTKELNFTLARTVSRDAPEKQSAEDILHNMFNGGKNK